jgi:hypothetical protein
VNLSSLYDMGFVLLGEGLSIQVGTPVNYENACMAPVIEPAGQVASAPITVTIRCSSPQATIFYTTDGSTPSPTHGTLYTGGFTMSSATLVTISAMATSPGLANSGVSQSYFTT